jgi:hypothetical protein
VIITYRGWHRDRGGNRIVDIPIDALSPRQVGPDHPYPRDLERAVTFPEVFYCHTVGGERLWIDSGNWRTSSISEAKPVHHVEGILVRAKGAVTANAEHEVDVFLSKKEVYLLFLQAFGDQAVRTLMLPSIPGANLEAITVAPVGSPKEEGSS